MCTNEKIIPFQYCILSQPHENYFYFVHGRTMISLEILDRKAFSRRKKKYIFIKSFLAISQRKRYCCGYINYLRYSLGLPPKEKFSPSVIFLEEYARKIMSCCRVVLLRQNNNCCLNKTARWRVNRITSNRKIKTSTLQHSFTWT